MSNNYTNLTSESLEMREKAQIALDQTKEKIARRSKEFVSRRIDPRTVVMARPKHIKDIIKQINKDEI